MTKNILCSIEKFWLKFISFSCLLNDHERKVLFLGFIIRMCYQERGLNLQVKLTKFVITKTMFEMSWHFIE